MYLTAGILLLILLPKLLSSLGQNGLEKKKSLLGQLSWQYDESMKGVVKGKNCAQLYRVILDGVSYFSASADNILILLSIVGYDIDIYIPKL